MDDFAVIGGGIGGAGCALFLSENHQTTLYEKEPYLGGCSSTFKHKGHFYNTGATTFAGYTKNSYMYTLFETYGVHFEKKKLDAALTVLMGEKTIHRFADRALFLEEINKAFYHSKNKAFYELICKLSERFFALDAYMYSNASFLDKLRSLTSFTPLLRAFYPYLFTNAHDFIRDYFGEISPAYLDYLDNQVLIVAQAKLSSINMLTAALALSYQFLDNYYIYGGMGSIFEGIERVLPQVEKKCFIQNIIKESDHFILQTNRAEFKAKNIVLNSSLFDAGPLFDDKTIVNYLKQYEPLSIELSAFMVYLEVETSKPLDHHYQIILPYTLPYTISNSIFVSFGDSEDAKMKHSVTISVHTTTRQWPKERSLEQKNELEAIIKEIVCEHLYLLPEEIRGSFSATPQTFKRFINRSTLGGIPMLSKNLIYKLPANDAPIKGLFHVGDTTFAGQGWLGVMMGVRNLQRLLCKN
jgi:phytoene dehydrogenase-like protein